MKAKMMHVQGWSQLLQIGRAKLKKKNLEGPKQKKINKILRVKF
jgi:hypothetical protein